MEPFKELVEALADGRAVALVGSGASVPSGLPTWRRFLQDFYEKFKPSDVTHNPSWLGVNRFIQTEGEFLLAAELLEQLIPTQDYSTYIESVFLGPQLKPSDIHRAIARLPINVLLTTNFDRLLEGAYRDPPLVFNWTEPQEILQNAKLGANRIIVKMHGTAEKPETVRLTRTHYRDQQHRNPAFNECLKILLHSRTFLFVGYSLRDSDLLRLIDEAKVLFRDRFGPHYALLPADEADPTFSEYLRRALGVVVIPYDPGKTPLDKTANVVGKLKDIAGRVARVRHARMPLPDLSDTSFCRRTACQKLLEQAVELTGSLRGDICLVADETNRKLVRTVTVPQGDFALLPEPTMDSVTGTTYLEPNNSGDCTYIPDTSTNHAADRRLKELGYTDTLYKVCDPNVRSEVACPIVSDGERVGVLNLESNLLDAYTQDHFHVVRLLAAQAGSIYFEAKQRDRPGQALRPFYGDKRTFTDLMHKCRLVRELGLSFILYDINHEDGKLFDWGEQSGNGTHPFEYRFEEQSLATEVFKLRRGIIIDDIEAEMLKPNPIVGQRGRDHYNIRSNRLFCAPVKRRGQTVAILALWPAREIASPKLRGRSAFQAVSERAYRMANLISNDLHPGAPTARDFFNYIDEELHRIDHGKVWDDEILSDPASRVAALRVLMSGLVMFCDIERVRIWRRIDLPDGCVPRGCEILLYCVDSLTSKDGTYLDRNVYGAYEYQVGYRDDKYCAYTQRRFIHDPYAQWQHRSMFGGYTDPNCQGLHKNPDAPWMVAPVVNYPSGVQPAYGDNSRETLPLRKPKLLGCISADRQKIRADGSFENEKFDPSLTSFQLRALDLVSDVSRLLLQNWGDPDWDRIRESAIKRNGRWFAAGN